MDCYLVSRDEKLKSKLETILQHIQSNPYQLPFLFSFIPYSTLVQTWLFGVIRESYSITDLKCEHIPVHLSDGGVACLLISYPSEVKSTTPILLLFPTLGS